jgi:hypothetical protein
MKNIFLTLACILFISTLTNAQYRINKAKFDYRTYQHQIGDPYNPIVAGISSFLSPGTGQMTSGEFVRGAVFLGMSVGSWTLFFSGVNLAFSNSAEELGVEIGAIMGLSGLVGILGVDLLSIVDAVRVAKVNDLAFRNNNKTSFNIQVQPYVNTTCYTKAGSIPAGITLKVTF